MLAITSYKVKPSCSSRNSEVSFSDEHNEIYACFDRENINIPAWAPNSIVISVTKASVTRTFMEVNPQLVPGCILIFSRDQLAGFVANIINLS